MYMRVTRGRWPNLATVDDEANKMIAELVAAVKRQPGNQSYVTGVDRASGRTVAVSTWDTEEHAQWSPAALGDVLPRLQARGLQIDPPEILEVIG